MSITTAGTVLLAIGAYVNCAAGGICGHDDEIYASKIALWAGESVSVAAEYGGPVYYGFSEIPPEVLLDVPFTSQAPYRDWYPPYDEACEEASVIMVEYWLRNEPLTPERADYEIKRLVEAETNMGWGIDISASQAGEIAKKIYGRDWRIYQGPEVTERSLIELLLSGYALIVPVSGIDLNNPNFTGAGPPYHMIVLTGYDKDNFFAHDPGTQFGKNYKYPKDVLLNAIHDWTGSKNTVRDGEKTVLVLKRSDTAGYVAAYGF